MDQREHELLGYNLQIPDLSLHDCTVFVYFNIFLLGNLGSWVYDCICGAAC